MALELLANVVILCFEKWRPKQKYCCTPKSKHFAQKKNLYWLRHCHLMFLTLNSQKMKFLIIVAIYSVLLVSFCNLIFPSIFKPYHQRGFESAICFPYL